MSVKGFFIPEKLIREANIKSNIVSVLIEDGVISLIEEDEELCYDFFVSEESEHKKLKQMHRQLLSKKSTVYISADIRKSLGIEVGDILQLFRVKEGLLIKKEK